MIARGENLRADAGRMIGHEREQSVRGRSGDDFDAPFVLKFFERGDQIAAVMPPRLAREGKAMVIHPREVAIGAIPMRAVDFFFREFDEAVEMPGVTVSQQLIQQHRAERGREREGETRVKLVALPVPDDLDQGQVGLGDGLEQPAFFEKFFMLRMPHERQVRVQDDGEIALHTQNNL